MVWSCYVPLPAIYRRVILWLPYLIDQHFSTGLYSPTSASAVGEARSKIAVGPPAVKTTGQASK
jgi:hypothetical protein